MKKSIPLYAVIILCVLCVGLGVAGTLAIREAVKEIKEELPSPSTSSSDRAVQSDIGIEKAKEIALKDANLTSDKVTFTKAILEKDDKRYVYDIEFFAERTEYSYEISATDGTILDIDKDYD